MAGRGAVLRVLAFLVAGGCASAYRASADREGEAILQDKMALVQHFRRSDLIRPSELPGSDASGARKAPVEVPKSLDLQSAIHIATAYNREYQSRREAFFLSALGLGLTRHQFLDPIFSAVLSENLTVPRHGTITDSTRLNGAVNHLLPWGGSVTASGSTSLHHDAGIDGRDQNVSASGSVSIDQPLLRGAGHGIAFEGLTQAERNVLYAARSFELYRETFAISVISDYYGLVRQKLALENTKSAVDAQDFARKQAEALYELGQGTQGDVFRAEQAYLEQQNSYLDAQQAYDLALDRFKVFLGVPTDVEFDLTGEFPEKVVPINFNTAAAVKAALHNRLDLRTEEDQLEDVERQVAIAKNALLPQLDFTAGYSTGSTGNSYRDLSFRDDALNFGLNLKLPLDLKSERNSYRSALISLAQSRRSLREAEDNVILEVRDSLRSVRQGKISIEIEEKNIANLKRRVRRAFLENEAGVASNRDLVEARTDLTVAQNSLLSRKVDYEISRLNLLQRLGILFVGPQGDIQK